MDVNFFPTGKLKKKFNHRYFFFRLCLVDIMKNKIPKQSQCFSYHKVSRLSRRLSQVSMAGIYLSPELG